MAIASDEFRKRMKHISIDTSNNAVSIHLHFDVLGEKLDRAQAELDAQVWSDMKQYMPFGQGALIQQTDLINKGVRGEVYKYPPGHDYGHYLYVGEKYVDPKYGKGGFTDGDQWWSRPGVTKIPSGEPLQYDPTHNPLAQSNWDEAAIQNHKQEWMDLVRRIVT